MEVQPGGKALKVESDIERFKSFLSSVSHSQCLSVQ